MASLTILSPCKLSSSSFLSSSSSSLFSRCSLSCKRIGYSDSRSRTCASNSFKCELPQPVDIGNGKPVIPILNERTLPKFLESARMEATVNRKGAKLKVFSGTANPALSQPVILDYLASKRICSDDLVVVSPDIGGVARARSFAKKLSDAPLAIVDKRRHGHNVAEVMNLIGDVKGKVAVMVDDMIDTAGCMRWEMEAMGSSRQTVKRAEQLVEKSMKGNDASHDAAHVWRVRDLALSLAREEGFSSNPDSMDIVELAALLHDIGDYKYLRDPSEEKLVQKFLEEEGIPDTKKIKILSIIKRMGFKDELAGVGNQEFPPEFGVVQDADRLDAIGAIGIARCFTFGGNRNRLLHDPAIQPRFDLSKEQYMKKEEQTTVNHFHEKLLKLKDLMKTKAGLRRAEKRHKFMEEFLKKFYEEWDGKA